MNTTQRQADKEEDTSVRHSEIWQRISLTVFLVIIILFGLFTFWITQPSKVLVVNNDPVSVRPQEVRANGGVVVLAVDFCKKSDAVGMVNVYLVGETSGSKIAISWPIDRSKAGCNKFDVPVPVPAQTPTDSYYVVFEITYQVNPIKSGYTTFRTQTFKVVNEKLQPGDAKPQPQ